MQEYVSILLVGKIYALITLLWKYFLFNHFFNKHNLISTLGIKTWRHFIARHWFLVWMTIMNIMKHTVVTTMKNMNFITQLTLFALPFSLYLRHGFCSESRDIEVKRVKEAINDKGVSRTDFWILSWQGYLEIDQKL